MSSDFSLGEVADRLCHLSDAVLRQDREKVAKLGKKMYQFFGLIENLAGLQIVTRQLFGKLGSKLSVHELVQRYLSLGTIREAAENEEDDEAEARNGEITHHVMGRRAQNAEGSCPPEKTLSARTVEDANETRAPTSALKVTMNDEHVERDEDEREIVTVKEPHSKQNLNAENKDIRGREDDICQTSK